jgi:acyl carrier protein
LRAATDLEEATVIDRFAAAVARYPDHLAVSDRAGTCTYAELASLVSRSAVATAAAVEGRPGPVAIVLRHELRFPAALLGVLAAGRGYLALDADHPADRNSRIAMHAGVAAVVTAGRGGAEAVRLFQDDVPVVDLNDLAKAPGPPPQGRPHPEDLAWITYTSGSTGVPKGVYQDHRGLLHDLDESIETTGTGPQDRVAMFASPSLLNGTRISLGSLICGASVHVLDPRELGPAGVLREVRARGITVFRSVPALFARVAESLGDGEKLESLRLVYLGGDRVGWNDYDLFRRISSAGARFGTHLGATECSTIYLHWLVSEDLRVPGGQLPVGRPLPGRQVRLLDGEREVAVGEVGEFVVAGRFLARGYWNDPDLTARAFGVDPADPAMRTFRTGDLGRLRPDGLFEFVGRKDVQIKLRGFRIEPSEIEGALRNCVGVRDAAIVVRRNAAGVPRAAIGYVELSKGVRGMQPRHLLAMVSQVLPRHMVPASIFIEPDLPRLVNMKLDRQRLVELDRTRLEAEAKRSTNPLIATIIEIFEQALEVSGATAADNFFSLGGDSLQAVEVIAALEQRLGMEIPDDVFDTALSIDELARWIASRPGDRRT